jgi:hypothetical protein
MLPLLMRSWHLRNLGNSNVKMPTFSEHCGGD